MQKHDSLNVRAVRRWRAFSRGLLLRREHCHGLTEVASLCGLALRNFKTVDSPPPGPSTMASFRSLTRTCRPTRSGGARIGAPPDVGGGPLSSEFPRNVFCLLLFCRSFPRLYWVILSARCGLLTFCCDFLSLSLQHFISSCLSSSSILFLSLSLSLSLSLLHFLSPSLSLPPPPPPIFTALQPSS